MHLVLACLLAALLAGCASMGNQGGLVTIAPAPSVVATAGRQEVRLPLVNGRANVRSPTWQRQALHATMSEVPQLTPPVAASTAYASAERTDDNQFDVVPVFWGTDRAMPSRPLVGSGPISDTSQIETGSVDKVDLPGTERGSELTLGRSYVTIPKVAREKGKILRPWQFTFLNITFYSQAEDPRQHFTLGSFEVMDRARFVREANQNLANATRFQDQAFVFVHGFNTAFDGALYRTAQLAHDLEFDGVAYMYSWPSRGTETAYLYDRDSADRARRYFREFLEMIATQTGARKVHVIAHSLGTRPLLEALRHGGQPTLVANRLKIDQIVLAAPDIDRDLFVDIARQVKGAARGATLYASSKDRALQLSRKIAGGEPRAGDVPDGRPVIVDGIDSIDISDAGEDGWLTVNHTTYAEGSHILSDLRLLLRSGIRPPDRRFAVYQRQEVPGKGVFWRYSRN